MAEKLKDYDFEVRRTREPKYPWDEWSDGSIWRIKKGEDFDVQPMSMYTAIRNWGSKHGYLPTIRVEKEDEAVVFQMLKESA